MFTNPWFPSMLYNTWDQGSCIHIDIVLADKKNWIYMMLLYYHNIIQSIIMIIAPNIETKNI